MYGGVVLVLRATGGWLAFPANARGFLLTRHGNFPADLYEDRQSKRISRDGKAWGDAPPEVSWLACIESGCSTYTRTRGFHATLTTHAQLAV